jgi:hypothetical protein
MNYFIAPSAQAIESALESWQWLDLQGKNAMLVTAFADVFFSAPDAIWFLDTLEGKLRRVFGTREELERSLGTAEGQDHYLLSPFIDRAVREGLILSDSQCYDFKIHPIVGGQIVFENIERRDFKVALYLRGQLHDQVRHLKPGTKISGFKLAEEQARKPWWRLW